MGSTMQLFRSFRIPRSECSPVMSAAFSHVPSVYKVMFHGYTIREWAGFNENASRVLVGDQNQNISATDWACIQSLPHGWKAQGKPLSEGGLLSGFEHNVLYALNMLRRGRSDKWRSNPNQTVSSIDMKGKNRRADFVLGEQVRIDRGGSSSSKTANQVLALETFVVGEVKAPKVDLGPRLSTTKVNDLLQHKDYLKTEEAKPFFQVFSYMLRTRKGIGILSNYDHSRFFKINAGRKEIYMSPLVRVEQVLSRSEGTPHTFQTFLYVDAMEDQFENKELKRILNVQLDEARKEAERKEKKMGEEEAAKESKKAGGSSSSDQKKAKNTSKSGDKHGKHRDGSHCTVSPVTLVMDKCEVIGTLGTGICGTVDEYDYEGMRVAVKAGFPFHPYKDEEDCFATVEHEIRIYEILEELQGRVIPRMIVGGFESMYCPESMVIITEKVGMPVTKFYGEVLVGEEKPSGKDLVSIREKGLEGLKAIHELGVVHGDAALRNIRVEMKDGKVDKVWWIDFGHACETYSDSMAKGDNALYKRDIDELLEMIDR